MDSGQNPSLIRWVQKKSATRDVAAGIDYLCPQKGSDAEKIIPINLTEEICGGPQKNFLKEYICITISKVPLGASKTL